MIKNFTSAAFSHVKKYWFLYFPAILNAVTYAIANNYFAEIAAITKSANEWIYYHSPKIKDWIPGLLTATFTLIAIFACKLHKVKSLIIRIHQLAIVPASSYLQYLLMTDSNPSLRIITATVLLALISSCTAIVNIPDHGYSKVESRSKKHLAEMLALMSFTSLIISLTSSFQVSTGTPKPENTNYIFAYIISFIILLIVAILKTSLALEELQRETSNTLLDGCAKVHTNITRHLTKGKRQNINNAIQEVISMHGKIHGNQNSPIEIINHAANYLACVEKNASTIIQHNNPDLILIKSLCALNLRSIPLFVRPLRK